MRAKEKISAIKRARGILKRKAGEKPLAVEWTEHKESERELERRVQKTGK